MKLNKKNKVFEIWYQKFLFVLNLVSSLPKLYITISFVVYIHAIQKTFHFILLHVAHIFEASLHFTFKLLHDKCL